jgi:hypothetical protein
MYIRTLHTISGEDIKAQQGHNIQEGQTELHQKHTSNKIGLRPHSAKYSVQYNLVYTAITGHNVTHRYKEHNDQKGQISYRPKACFTLSREKNNERSRVTQGKGGGAHCHVDKQPNTLLTHPPHSTPPPPKNTQPYSSDKTIALHQQTLYQQVTKREQI